MDVHMSIYCMHVRHECTRNLTLYIVLGYVTYSVNKFEKLRHEYFGALWGGMENLFQLALKLILDSEVQDDVEIIDKILRYIRLTIRLLFLAAQEKDNLTEAMLVDEGLATIEEIEWLQDTVMGTRPLMTVGWIGEIFHAYILDGKSTNRRKIFDSDILTFNNAMSQARAGIGLTMGAIGCPAPFCYVHAVQWCAHISMIVLGVETGCLLAINYERRVNGKIINGFCSDIIY